VMCVPVVEQSINELTYKELKAMIDPNYLRARERIRELRKRGTRFDRLKGSSMIFRTHSSEFGKNGIIYEQEIKLLDLSEALNTPDVPLRDRVHQALQGDVALRCTCPAFVYWGFGYILYSQGAAAAGRTLWPTKGGKSKGGRRKRKYKCSRSTRTSWPAPVKTRPKYYGYKSPCNRNWQLKGVMCKHLGLVMEVVGAYEMTLMRELKSQGYE
jgi:hypothetical protein